MDSMRLEKSYRLIPREMSIEYAALESGLERFVKLDKSCDFVGKQALQAWQQRGFENAFAAVTFAGATHLNLYIFCNGDHLGADWAVLFGRL